MNMKKSTKRQTASRKQGENKKKKKKVALKMSNSGHVEAIIDLKREGFFNPHRQIELIPDQTKGVYVRPYRQLGLLLNKAFLMYLFLSQKSPAAASVPMLK